MLISNAKIFDLSESSTPGLLWGSLDPLTQFASEPLASAALGSLYVQLTSEICSGSTQTGAKLWQKQGTGTSQDNCGCIHAASADDWCEYSKGGILCGTTDITATVAPWSTASEGSLYLKDLGTTDCSGNKNYEIWLKTCTNCTDGAWIQINQTGKTTVSTSEPWNDTSVWGNNSEIGDVHFHRCNTTTGVSNIGTAQYNYVRYEKITCTGNDQNDWVNTSDNNTLLMATWTGDGTSANVPTFDCTDADIACMPIGSRIYFTGSDIYFERKTRTATCADDWVMGETGRNIRIWRQTAEPTGAQLGDIWIHPIEDDDANCTSACGDRVDINVTGVAGASTNGWKRIHDNEANNREGYITGSTGASIPANILTFPATASTFSAPADLPNGFSTELTFDMVAPAVVSFQGALEFSNVPVDVTNNLNSSAAVAVHLVVDGNIVWARSTQANDFDDVLQLTVTHSMFLGCGMHTAKLQFTNAWEAVEGTRQQDVFIEQASLDLHWGGQC